LPFFAGKLSLTFVLFGASWRMIPQFSDAITELSSPHC
jgi:hypothetical protein